MIGLFVALVMIKNPVQAENGLNYSIDPELPKSMQEKGFYDFKHVKMNQTFKLSFYVKNYSNHKIKVLNAMNNAHNSNGSIVYDGINRNDDYNPINPNLSDLVIGKQKKVLNLKAHQRKKVTFKIKTPKDPIIGTILGGINISEKIGQNNINFSISVALSRNSSSSDLEKLKLSNFKPTKDQLKFSIVNDQPEIAHNYKVKSMILNSNEEIVKKANDNYSMVPQSFGKYQMNYEDLNPGVYLMKLSVYDTRGHVKHFNKYFKVDGQLKKQNHFQFNFKLWMIVFVVLLTYALLLMGVYEIKKNR